MTTFRKPHEVARKPLYPTSTLEAIERTTKEAMPAALDGRHHRPRSRAEGVTVEDPDVGYEVDDAFIREQRMLLEKIQNRRQTTEDTFLCGSDASASCVDASRPVKMDSSSAPERGVWPQGVDSEGHGHDVELRVANMMLCDWQVIQEHQQRVLDRVQKQSKLPKDESRSTDQQALTGVDLELEYYQSQQQQELDRIARARDRHRSVLTVDENPSVAAAYGEGTSSSINRGSPESLHRKPSPIGDTQGGIGKLKFQDTTRDVTTTLSNGKKLKLKGTKHTLKAISDGTAILVSCAECQTVLQVPSSCTAVYCCQCQAVTPMDLARSISDSFHDDSDLARALQQQELDLASARDPKQSEANAD